MHKNWNGEEKCLLLIFSVQNPSLNWLEMFYPFILLVCIPFGTTMCSPDSKARYEKNIEQKKCNGLKKKMNESNKMWYLYLTGSNQFVSKNTYSTTQQSSEDFTKALREAVKNGRL